MKLTEKQRTVLEFLASRNLNIDGAMTGAEIGRIVFRGDRTKSGRDEWANPALRSLRAKGLAEPLGTFGNARTWAATPAGRALLAEEKQDG
ncbi:hypothetical protein ACP4J4_10500 [Aureimonas ureilytica]|uniref:hypothetical protein n=1 Tax=Aureimonas ureilytica TaxID=401562 RepID=UPI003CF9E7F4